jgi:uncharacterized protein YggE
MHTLAFALLLMAAQRPEPPAQQPPVLVVSGSSEVLAEPDEAVVRLGIVKQANVAETAQQQANQVAEEILKAIGGVGVPSKDIQTSRLVLSPVYGRDAERRIVSYNATNTVSVRLGNLSIVGNVIDAGLKAGANELEGVQFHLKNELPSREQALREAVQEARGKAQAMAEALRVNLAEVLEATEGGVTVSPRVQALQAVAGTRPATPTPVSPGEIEIRANVTLRYRITQKP